MVRINFVIPSDRFKAEFRKIKDKGMKDKLKKQIVKIVENPDFGKPLGYGMRGERTIYVKPYRLIYAVEGDKLVLLKFEHRNHVYEKY
jgi:mRNA-degrading endonuclease RelE of RelBE toxin-antitoxin system